MLYIKCRMGRVWECISFIHDVKLFEWGFNPLCLPEQPQPLLASLASPNLFWPLCDYWCRLLVECQVLSVWNILSFTHQSAFISQYLLNSQHSTCSVATVNFWQQIWPSLWMWMLILDMRSRIVSLTCPFDWLKYIKFESCLIRFSIFN